MNTDTDWATDTRPDGEYVTIFDPGGGVTTHWITSDVAIPKEGWE